MTTPSPDPQPDTLTEIYDRLRAARRRRSRGAASLALVALAAAGCGLSLPTTPEPTQPTTPSPAVRVCGTIAPPGVVPIRLPDAQCTPPGIGSRWYDADPAQLDADDFTEVGIPLDDDYTDGEPGFPIVGPSNTNARPRTTTPTTSRATTPAPRPRATPRVETG